MPNVNIMFIRPVKFNERRIKIRSNSFISHCHKYHLNPPSCASSDWNDIYVALNVTIPYSDCKSRQGLHSCFIRDCTDIGHWRHLSPVTKMLDTSLHFLDQYWNLPTKIRTRMACVDVFAAKQDFDDLVGYRVIVRGYL